MNTRKDLTEGEKLELASRFGDPKIHKRGRKEGYKTPGYVIRELMEGEFQHLTEKNVQAVVNELQKMALYGEGKEKMFAIKTILDVNNRIIDREIEENKDGNGETINVVVNRAGVSISKGAHKLTVALEEPTEEKQLLDLNKELIENVKSLDPPPDELIEAMGYDEACEFWYNSEEVEDGLQEEKKG